MIPQKRVFGVEENNSLAPSGFLTSDRWAQKAFFFEGSPPNGANPKFEVRKLKCPPTNYHGTCQNLVA